MDPPGARVPALSGRAAASDDDDALRRAAGAEFDIGSSKAVCCVIRAGRLALAFASGAGRDRTIGILEEGDLLVRPTDGWTAADPRVRCVALEDALVVPVGRARLHDWLRPVRSSCCNRTLLLTRKSPGVSGFPPGV